MALNVPPELLASVSRAISDFGMFADGSPLIVAFSGGKDSIATAAALALLGYDPLAAAVDLGYTDDWGPRVKGMADSVVSRSELVRVRSEEFQRQLAPDARHRLAIRLRLLDELDITVDRNATPCTQCYNTKVTALESLANRRRAKWIVFGHHATDAIASLVKSALMYIDRWDRNHASYDRDTFAALVTELNGQILSAEQSPLVSRIETLVDQGLAGTDEPPIQQLTSTSALRVARPMFYVFEHEILELKARVDLATEASGCAHTQSANTETPREMVHNRILRHLPESPEGLATLHRLFRAVLACLKGDGTLKLDARRLRDSLLGVGYRASTCSDEKL